MKRRNTILCSVVFTLLFISVQSQLIAKVKIRRIRQEGQVILIVQDCKLKLKQSATGFEFGGLDFTSGPLKKAGSIKVDQKLLQSMNAEAQILDQFQFDSCQQINTIPLSDPKRTSLVALNGLSNYQLAQLALFAQMYSDNAEKLQDVLLKWIVSSSELAQQVWAKQFLSAESTAAQQRAKAAKSLEFALATLKVSPGSPEFKSLLSDQLKSAIQ